MMFIISDELLYLAERTPGLESLVLSRLSRISREGFAKALSNWKNVKQICFGRFSGIYFKQIIEEIGRNCTELTSLHIHHPCLHLNAENAKVVLKNLPKLKTIKFEGACLFRGESYSLLWTESSMLEAIYFSDCFLMREDLINLDKAQSIRFIFDKERNLWKAEC
ncbi:putative F-box/LRR-repeat protein 23 [Pistacia vera]|uniref:putative F-box/LRR-repeat protein 23 n=1 Tax=Pistacia vera TaxID=55513 RepID=UPI0012634882|nr:putative F-box/LRR-repeat protein 23 [Pistacia vera]